MPTKLAPGIRQKGPGYFEVRFYGGLDPVTGEGPTGGPLGAGTVKDADMARTQLSAQIEQRGVESNPTVSGASLDTKRSGRSAP